jgi:hypothetical protein
MSTNLKKKQAMHSLKSRFEQICKLEDNISALQKELEACTDTSERQDIQKRFDTSVKKTVGEFKTIFAEGPLSEETFFKAKTLYEEVGQSNSKIEWLYSMMLYLDLEEKDASEISETPFSGKDIAYIPELAAANVTHNPKEQLEIMNNIAESLRDHVSTTLSTFEALLADTPTTAIGDDAEIFPGEPVARLSEYIALMKKLQSGDMQGACVAAGIDMMQFSQVSQRWAMRLASDTELAMKFGRLMS